MSLIDRVAEAIEAAEAKILNELDMSEPWGREVYERLSRAAIEAMREPTEEMVEALASEMDPTWAYPDETIAHKWAEDGYAKLIDAALSQDKGEG